jgi:hypothetical protein
MISDTTRASVGATCYPAPAGLDLCLTGDTSFERNLASLVQLIKRMARDRSPEHTAELLQLRDIIEASLDPKNWSWLRPTIRGILATRLEALHGLKYGDLDQCLDRFYMGLLLLATTGRFEAQLDLAFLRREISEREPAEFSKWLIATIDAALGGRSLESGLKQELIPV